jgi:hypothetical protein
VVAELAEESGLDMSAGPQQIEDELRAAPASAWLSSASEVEDAPSRGRLKVLLACLALIAAVVVVIAVTHGSSDSGSSAPVASASETSPSSSAQAAPSAQPVPLAPLAGSSSTADATAQLTGPHSVAVQVNGLPSPGKGAYRLWLFNSVIDSRPIGALTSGSGAIDATLPPNASRYRYLDVTREGSPTDNRYSGLVVLRVPARTVLAEQP